jgi:hypothetical protein
VVNQDQWDAAVAQVKEQADALHVLMNIVGSNALVRFPEERSPARRAMVASRFSSPVNDGANSVRDGVELSVL